MAKAGGRAACGGMKGASVRSACDGGAGAEAPGKTICDIKKGMFANGHRDLVLAQARTQRHGNKREGVRKEQGGTYMACRKLAGEKTKHEQPVTVAAEKAGLRNENQFCPESVQQNFYVSKNLSGNRPEEKNKKNNKNT